MTDTEYQSQRVPQSRGPTLHFDGKVLIEAQWEIAGRNVATRTIFLFETPTGNWVAVRSHVGNGPDDIRAVVIEAREDEQAMLFEAMELWDWHDRARSAARKLGLSLSVEVA